MAVPTGVVGCKRMLGGLLLQSQHFAAGEETKGLLEAPQFRFLTLGGLNPGEIAAAMRGRQRFEMAQGLRVLLQRGLDVRGKL